MAKHPLKKFREDQQPKLSVTKLAQRLGVQPATVSRWENGERFPDRIYWPRIRAVTGLSIEDLDGRAA